MKCMNDCGKDVAGKSQYCSKSCRAIASRKRSAAPTSAAQQPSAAPVSAASKTSHPDTQHIWDKHQAQHRPMTYPCKFNDKIGLALPGAPDYEGVCYKDEAGVWNVGELSPKEDVCT